MYYPLPGLGKGRGSGVTHHCCELVELGPQVGAPEVDVGGFVPHLVAAGTGVE